MSDLLFAVLSCALASLWLGRSRPANLWEIGATGLLLGLMFFTRTAAAPLVLGAGVAMGVLAWGRRSWWPLVFGAAPAIAAAVIWVAMPKDTFSYGHYYRATSGAEGGILASGLLNVVTPYAGRVIGYASTHWIECLGLGFLHLIAAVFPQSAVWQQLVAGGTGLLAFVAFAISVRGYWQHPCNTTRAIGGIWLLYGSLLALWPFDLGARGLMPILPFLGYGFFQGVARLPERGQRWACRMMAIFLIVGLLPSAYMTLSSQPNQPRAEELASLSRWVGTHVPRTARICTEKDWFKSDFPAMHFVAGSGHQLTDTGGENLAVARADYIIFEGFPALKDSIDFPGQSAFGKVIHRTPQDTFQLVEVVRGVAASP